MEMKKVEVFPCGYKVYDDNDNLIGYDGNYNGEGFIYKDEDAFLGHPDEICYIPESVFPEAEGEEAYDHEFGMVPVDIALKHGETRKTIAEQIADGYREDYMLTDEQIDRCTKSVFQNLEWSCVATNITESFWIEDLIDFSYGMASETVFTQFQYDAVMNGMTPKEYSERSLSYEEIVQFDKEFDDAFVTDEECQDDFSEAGLGANARITYEDDRRTGKVSGPEEFAEVYNVKEEWRKSTKS